MITTEVSEARRVQVPDDARHPVLLDGAAQVKVGDWMRDMGTLRQVRSIDALSVDGVRGETFIVHFEHQPGVKDFSLGIRANVSVTVWRTSNEPEREGR